MLLMKMVNTPQLIVYLKADKKVRVSGENISQSAELENAEIV